MEFYAYALNFVKVRFYDITLYVSSKFKMNPFTSVIYLKHYMEKCIKTI